MNKYYIEIPNNDHVLTFYTESQEDAIEECLEELNIDKLPSGSNVWKCEEVSSYHDD